MSRTNAGIVESMVQTSEPPDYVGNACLDARLTCHVELESSCLPTRRDDAARQFLGLIQAPRRKGDGCPGPGE